MASKKEEQIKAYMGEDAVFNGTLSFEGTVRIDGKFEGQVSTEGTLIIGEKGYLIADVSAGTVICKGKIEGTITAKEKLEMHSSSQVTGAIKAPAVYMELGAVLDGNCDMSGEEGKIVKLVQKEEVENQAQ